MPHTELGAAPLDLGFLLHAPPPLFQPRGPSALPPSTQMTVGNDSHPFPVPSQGPCSQKGSFPELSPEQAHLPLPTLLGESVGTGTRPSDPGRC